MKYLDRLKQFLNKKVIQPMLIYRRIAKYDFSNVSIMSSDCSGGIICHDFGLRFNSPTVNCFINGCDFIKFCRNIKHYLNEDIVFKTYHPSGFPICTCGDIEIYCVHYKTPEEFRNKWDERKKRVCFDNIILLLNERQIESEDQISEFAALNMPKIMFVSREHKYKYNFEYRIREFDRMFMFKGISGRRYYEDDFNFSEFMSKGQ